MHFVQAKGILSQNNGMNIYRGCSHGCIYCDSRSRCYGFTHSFEDIEVKENAPELLERSLRSRRHKCMIGTGAMCDPYLPAEKELQLSRKCLELIDRYEYGVTVLTKSNLVLRDLDLLQSINKKTKAVVQMTLTTYDEYLAMLEAFTTGDPDGNGVDGDTYGVSSAGLIGTEAPYTNYLPEFYQDIVTDELNVKEIELTDDVRAFTSYTFKPQLKTVGPKYGKMLGGIKAALNDIDGNAAMDELNATGALKLDVNGQEIELFKEDLLIDTAQIEGYESVNDNGITVVLDTNLSPELLEEGFVREIISKIQTMRKEADFEVMDRIKVTYEGSEKAEAVFEKNNTLIAGEVLADEVVKAQPAGYVKEWKINGEVVTMGVEKKGE